MNDKRKKKMREAWQEGPAGQHHTPLLNAFQRTVLDTGLAKGSAPLTGSQRLKLKQESCDVDRPAVKRELSPDNASGSAKRHVPIRIEIDSD